MQQNTIKGGPGRNKCETERKKITLKLETVLDKAFRHPITWKSMKNSLNGRQKEQD